MTNWIQVEPKIVEIVRDLPPKGSFMIQREFPGCQLMFSRIDNDGHTTLRTEVCNNDPEENERISSRGWELKDPFGGVWRREVPWPTDEKILKQQVAEGTHILRNVWREVTLNGFQYLAWIDTPPPPGWMFWKSKKDKEIEYPDLGLPKMKS